MTRLDEIRALVAEPGFDPVDLVVADIAYLLRFTDPEMLARALATHFGDPNWHHGLVVPQDEYDDCGHAILAALEAQDD